MFIFVKLSGIGVLLWFYFTAKALKAPKIKWPVIGLIGYWLAWIITFLMLGDIFSATGVGLGTAYLVRKKLIYDFTKETT